MGKFIAMQVHFQRHSWFVARHIRPIIGQAMDAPLPSKTWASSRSRDVDNFVKNFFDPVFSEYSGMVRSFEF